MINFETYSNKYHLDISMYNFVCIYMDSGHLLVITKLDLIYVGIK